MSSQDRTSSSRRGKAKVLAIAGAGALLLTGCSEQVQRGWLPNESRDITNHTASIQDLWVHTWVTVLLVGIMTWGLMIWCIVAYRRRKGEVGFPRQLSYNLPMEILYTAVPLMMVLTFFTFSDSTQTAIEEPVDSELVVDVQAKQWAWDYNYSYQGEEKYDASVQAHLDGSKGKNDEIATLYLPVDTSVTLELNSRDVIHSFWVPAFLQKLDMIPGKTNTIYLTPQEEGTYAGKCAELCGEYHSEMLFNVEVVSEAEFKSKLSEMEDGHIGKDYSRKPDEVNSITIPGEEGE
ncbi:MAG: aa3-type cytochrome oxidase subunit II [Arthrobacter sp.]|uniref:aa3-type cytochrome oxidase subunit II n=1 Tax=unclassified Arthrobacter TaxID=235627 RepID=UPI00264FF9CE|nr:cytochrome c oxidase subunit II [Micrococcaceae bacterium]MDN5823786.1 cytochrome c oxidase subunit II [Micrococcaceae bacterium]MDN5879221.1 cytochrome c oxidase subunit II [Micrococcaceae bacterium]MDN5887037.1 cytochrome c oxidase subunit II [Micrococcaceae bacterium]MDN5904938.1 cytochrome c oxidase subunit II [Micrococcaceae bacterium]